MTLRQGFGQRLQNKRSGGAEVAGAMLLVDGQRLAGLAAQVHGHAARGEQRVPGGRGSLHAPRPPLRQGETAQRFGPQPGIPHARRGGRGAGKAGFRAGRIVETFVDTSEAETLVATLRRRQGSTGSA